MQAIYHSEPVPHIQLTHIVSPDAFHSLPFPEIKRQKGGRTGFDIFEGDPEHSQVLVNSGWRDLHARFSGKTFITSVLELFANDMTRYGCLLDSRKVVCIELEERGKDVLLPSLNSPHPREALFTRFDFQAADESYPTYSHLDWPRRVVGGVLFFSDATTDAIEGGEFAFYGPQSAGAPPTSDPLKTFPVQGNTGVLFLNCDVAFHGPTKIRSMRCSRRWIYVSISSSQNVWPRGLEE